MIAKMEGTKSSAIWKYFEIPTADNKHYAKCKLCGEFKSLGSAIPRLRTLGCLKNHIKRKHRMEWPKLNQDLKNSISKSKIGLAQEEFEKRLKKCPKKAGENVNNFDQKAMKNVDLKCYLCDMEFKISTEFVEHNQKSHPGVQTMICHYCKKIFRQPASFKEHIEIVHEQLRYALPFHGPNEIHKGKIEIGEASNNLTGTTINGSNFDKPICKLENYNTGDGNTAVNQPSDYQFVAFMKDENQSVNSSNLKLENEFPALDPLFVQWVQKNIGTGNIKEEKHNHTGLADSDGVKIEEFYDDVTEND